MDRLPLIYRAMALELEREGKLRPSGTADGEKIADPRHYAYIEMKLANRDAAVAVMARLHGESVWRSSNLGRPDYAVARDGWARTTVELPPGTPPGRIAELAFACLVPLVNPPPPGGVCRIDAVSKAFLLGADYMPGPAFFRLSEPIALPTGLARAWPVSHRRMARTGVPAPSP
jgi:hypothetical protein